MNSHTAHEPGEPLPAADRALVDLAAALRDRGYCFTTVTPATHERVNARPENAWAQDLRGVFGWSRPFHAGVLPDEIWRLMREAGVAESHEAGWRSTVRLSTLNGRIFVHSAYPTQAPGAVFFGPDTYRFAAALQAHLDRDPKPVHRAVDIGCGAGPGAIEVAGARPEAEVLAVDLNDEALRLARINAKLANASNVHTRRSNLFDDVDGAFDLIAANPPYLVDPARRAYRHGGGALGAGLSLTIVDAALQRLAPGGTLLLYTGVAMLDGRDPFFEAVQPRLAARNLTWTYREIDPDVFGEELLEKAYADAERIAAVELVAQMG